MWKSPPVYLMRGINNLHTRKDNIRVSWEINKDHISYDEETALISHERDRQLHVRKRQPLYLVRGINLHKSCEEKTSFISHMRKRLYLYPMRGINSLYISLDKFTITTFISHKRDKQPLHIMRGIKHSSFGLLEGEYKLYKVCCIPYKLQWNFKKIKKLFRKNSPSNIPLPPPPPIPLHSYIYVQEKVGQCIFVYISVGIGIKEYHIQSSDVI